MTQTRLIEPPKLDYNRHGNLRRLRICAYNYCKGQGCFRRSADNCMLVWIHRFVDNPNVQGGQVPERRLNENQVTRVEMPQVRAYLDTPDYRSSHLPEV